MLVSLAQLISKFEERVSKQHANQLAELFMMAKLVSIKLNG